MPRRLKLLCCGPLFGGCWLDQRALCFFPHLVLERVDVAQHVRVVKLLQQLHLRVRGLRAQQGNQRERRVRREAQKKVSLRRGPPFLFRPARGGGNAPPPPSLRPVLVCLAHTMPAAVPVARGVRAAAARGGLSPASAAGRHLVRAPRTLRSLAPTLSSRIFLSTKHLLRSALDRMR